MGILLAFAPFIAFAIVDRLVGSLEGLCAGAAVSLGLLVKDAATPGRQLKILEIGTCVLFVALALYAWLARPDWSVIAVRLFVDAGLFILVITSLIIGRPFTEQYAREEVAPEFWASPEFRRTNNIISSVWALAFLAMVAAEAALLFVPGMSHRVGVIVIVAALVGAFKFTKWYPSRQ